MYTLKEILTILSGFLTPIIAVLAVMIAHRQYKIQKYRVRIDLFDRRFKIYNSIMEIMRRIRQHGSASNDQIFELIQQTADSKFLFKGEIKNHIETILQRASDLQELNQQLANPNLPKEGRARLAKEVTKHFKSFKDQFNRTDELFSKYLKLDE